MSSECMEKAKPGDRVHRINVLAAAAEAEDDTPICWVCLDHATLDKPLIHPCKCPSWCHSSCIARWQLQSAGTRREKYCDFCSSELPDWKSVLTPVPGATAPAVMNVNFDNKTYSFQVAPGVDGYRQFTEAIRKAFHLPDDSELNITFTCDEPSSGSLLTLSGPGAYDAAVHCASVSAARRSISGDSSSSSGASSPSFMQQQQQQALGFSRGLSSALSYDGSVDHDGIDQYPGSQSDPTAAAAALGRGTNGSQHSVHHRPSGSSSSSSRDLQDLILDRTASGSSSSDSGSSMVAGNAPFSAVSSRSEDPAAGGGGAADGAAAAATHYDPSASPPASEDGLSTPGRISESGSECSSDDTPAAAAATAAVRGDCCRPLSSASTSSAASSSGASAGGSNSSSSGRRGSGLGKKLRDAISELLISK